MVDLEITITTTQHGGDLDIDISLGGANQGEQDVEVPEATATVDPELEERLALKQDIDQLEKDDIYDMDQLREYIEQVRETGITYGDIPELEQEQLRRQREAFEPEAEPGLILTGCRMGIGNSPSTCSEKLDELRKTYDHIEAGTVMNYDEFGSIDTITVIGPYYEIIAEKDLYDADIHEINGLENLDGYRDGTITDDTFLPVADDLASFTDIDDYLHQQGMERENRASGLLPFRRP